MVASTTSIHEHLPAHRFPSALAQSNSGVLDKMSQADTWVSIGLSSLAGPCPPAPEVKADSEIDAPQMNPATVPGRRAGAGRICKTGN